MVNKLKVPGWIILPFLLVVFLPTNHFAQLVLKTEKGPYPSATPQYIFSNTLKEQEAELKNNPLMLRFKRSREKLASDRYRPLYHFVSPENMLNDPNGLCFWKGKWHMFYQACPPDEFPDPKDIKKRRQHWGHAVSDDLVYWNDLPYAIYPGIEKLCFSGSTWVEDDRVIAFYPGIEAGQMVAISGDPLLLNWDKSGPLNCDAGDADIWKEGDSYYGLIGVFIDRSVVSLRPSTFKSSI
ncbi:MAG: glycoside hydrolase family 32 protein [Ginsengibacter sp.]